MPTLHAFDFLENEKPAAPASAIVVFGDDDFLKQLVIARLRTSAGNDSQDAVDRSFDASAEWIDVSDALATVSLFGARSAGMVVVEQADDFVTRHRDRLEHQLGRKTPSTLVLEVRTWARNTRLYKEIDKSGLQIECRAPERQAGRRAVLDEKRIVSWLAARARDVHQANLPKPVAERLLERVGTNFGLLEQEIAKLSLYVELQGTLTRELVDRHVGQWQTRTTWEMMDAAASGDAKSALALLDRLLAAGEHPTALFGQISWSLRRFAAADRLYFHAARHGNRPTLDDALEQAGFRRWPANAIQLAEQQIRQLGRRRTSQLYRWLLETDLSLKGSHSAPHRARFALEQLVFRLAGTRA